MSRLLSPLSYGPPSPIFDSRFTIVDLVGAPGLSPRVMTRSPRPRSATRARQNEGRDVPAFALNPLMGSELPAPALAAAALAVAVVPAAAAAAATPAAVKATEVAAEATTAASAAGAAAVAVTTAAAGTAAEATTAGAATATTAEATATTGASATETTAAAGERSRLGLEAVTAVDRAVATGFERYLGFLAAGSACCVKKLPRRPAVSTAERATTRFAILLLLQPPAIRTTPGLPRKSLRSMKLLFTRGEHERLAAIAADERLVGVRHPIDLLD